MNWNRTLATLAFAALPALPAAAASYEAYTNRDVHLRAGPGPDYPVVGRLRIDTPVDVEGCLSDYSWCDVAIGYERGWVYATALDGVYTAARAPIGNVALAIGIPVITFSLISYWDRYYYNRPWYSYRSHWTHRPPGWRPPAYPLPPPGFLPPPPRPPGWRPLPPRPPQVRPPAPRPPQFGPNRPGSNIGGPPPRPRPEGNRPNLRPGGDVGGPPPRPRPEANRPAVRPDRPGTDISGPPPRPRPQAAERPRPQGDAVARPRPQQQQRNRD